VLLQILTAAGYLPSFAAAAEVLRILAGLSISPQHIQELACLIGTEMAQQRDQATADYVHHRRSEPKGEPAQAVTVALDGGRMMTREAGRGRGVHHQQWKEDKIASVQTYQTQSHSEDPRPEPPACFLDAPAVDRLVRQIQATTAPRPEEELPQLQELSLAESTLPTSLASSAVPEPPSAHEALLPRRTGRFCVATMQPSASFGKMVAAQVYQHNFLAAERRAVLGDGSAWIWTIQSHWFKDWTPILDFVHAVTYLYVTASVVCPSVPERWELYVDWLRCCWRGEVAGVIEQLREHLERLEGPPGRESVPRTDPRAVLQTTIGYLEGNASRMDYSRYRREGLPVTSSSVESLVKEFNARVKGTEKFWNRGAGSEAILQIRAGILGDEQSLAEHIGARPGSCYRRYKKRQKKQAA
jgi:hypothetical protein